MAFRLPQPLVHEMHRHAEATYPEECCGFVRADVSGTPAVRNCRNVQNELHAADPDQHPRDARTAYTIDPQELFRITREVDYAGGALIALYHSHPDHAAYFSAEDRARAVMDEWDEPLFPGIAYVVIAVAQGLAVDTRAFAWNEDQRDFLELPVETI